VKRKRLILLREGDEPERTHGRLFIGSNFLCYTMEPGTADRGHLRVEPGFYFCEPHGWEPDSPVRFRQTWALVGDGVSHQPEIGVPRSAVLWHGGVRDEHTTGCILVGALRGFSNGEPALLDSKSAMERMRDLIGHNEFCVTIMKG